MSQRLQEIGEALIRQIRTIRGQHKAGITPSFGQCEDLFDFADRLDIELKRIDQPRLMPCTIRECGRPMETTVDTRPYCLRCARALASLTAQIQGDAPELARQRIEAMVAGRAPWPSAAPVAEAGAAR